MSAETPGRQLFRMTWPMLFGVTSLLGFQLVDSAFIGRLGVRPLAALGFTVPVMQFVIGTQVGIGIATTAVIARVLGAGDVRRARRLGGLVVLAGSLVMLALMGVIWLLRGVLLDVMGADPGIRPLVDAYWVPWLVSAWLGAVLYLGYSVCRANGDTRLPGWMMVATSVVNLALDPLFIFTLGLGLPGAALATVVAFAAGAVVVYPALWRRGWLASDLGALPPMPALAELGRFAGPAMTGQLMPPLAAVVATALVAGFGSQAVAAWALGTRLEFFSLVVVLALTMSLPPLIGHLRGAGEVARIERLVRVALRFVVFWQLAVALVWVVGHDLLAGLLAAEAGVRADLAAYLVRVPLGQAGLGVCMLMVSVCNAMGMPLRALVASLLRLFVCFLPALWLGATVAGLEGAFTGVLAGNLAAGLSGWLLYRRGLSLLMREAGAPRATPSVAG